MTKDAAQQTVVTREVAADAGTVFALLADPRRHPEIDGSDTVRAAAGTSVLTGTGQVFVMSMDQTALGHPEVSDYETENLVVEFVPDALLTWETARPGKHPTGLWWSWALEPLGPGRVRVTHTYDWSRVTDPALLARINFPRIPEDALRRTLDRLAAAVETPGVSGRP